MLIKNADYGFSLVVPDDYREMRKEDFRKFGADRNTLYVFLKQEDGESLPIVLTLDAPAQSEKEYLKIVDANAEGMKLVGMTIDERVAETDGRARVDAIYSSFRGLRFSTRFTAIRGLTVAATVEIGEKDDESDRILSAIFDSFEEI